MTVEKLFMEMDECSDVPMGLLRHAARNRRMAAQRADRRAASSKPGYAATIGELAMAVGQ